MPTYTDEEYRALLASQNVWVMPHSEWQSQNAALRPAPGEAEFWQSQNAALRQANGILSRIVKALEDGRADRLAVAVADAREYLSETDS